MSILTAPKKTEKKERQKKPDELLASVVRETAVPAAVELLRSNAPFVFPSGTAWAILVLAAERIGGLSRKQGRDEAKGSLIELIEADSICTLATADMLSEEVFGIIPTTETLARMEEYSLLTAPTAADGKTPLYSWAVVYQNQNGLQVDLVADATFAMALGVSTGSIALKDAVGREAWAAHSGETDDEPTAEGMWSRRRSRPLRMPRTRAILSSRVLPMLTSTSTRSRRSAMRSARPQTRMLKLRRSRSTPMSRVKTRTPSTSTR
ncbi:hypothetical protein AHiyo8_02060 [Arthrobacter sp. Hiyo8]|nr:hypothetical protein AHiyo8_02060 [Arthrobacter sp. Hiyo8]